MAKFLLCPKKPDYSNFLYSLVFLSNLFHGQILLAAAPNKAESATNWTVDYGNGLALMALDFAAAAYAPEHAQEACLGKHNAKLMAQAQVPCDWINDTCSAFIALSPQWIVFSVRGTGNNRQLIFEILSTMKEPKTRFPGGGSVQQYFLLSTQAIWAKLGVKLAQLSAANPKLPILFTGYSLGGAIASLASSLFSMDNKGIKSSQLVLITFGQPRVGDMKYAQAHDRLMPNSFRLVHHLDVVPHLPTRLASQCTLYPNNCSFHHGTEIWYPSKDMAPSPPTSLFRICDGFPLGEDPKCSNGHHDCSVDDHFKYFDVDVHNYGSHGCSSKITGSPLVGKLMSFNDRECNADVL